MSKNQKSARVRITAQFHDKQGMVYELKCDDVVFIVSMVSGKQETEWAAEATAKVLPDPVVATGVGRSRGEAFSVLREAWCSGVQFPRLDWDAIKLALASVRAI